MKIFSGSAGLILMLDANIKAINTMKMCFVNPLENNRYVAVNRHDIKAKVYLLMGIEKKCRTRVQVFILREQEYKSHPYFVAFLT